MTTPTSIAAPRIGSARTGRAEAASSPRPALPVRLSPASRGAAPGSRAGGDSRSRRPRYACARSCGSPLATAVESSRLASGPSPRSSAATPSPTSSSVVRRRSASAPRARAMYRPRSRVAPIEEQHPAPDVDGLLVAAAEVLLEPGEQQFVDLGVAIQVGLEGVVFPARRGIVGRPFGCARKGIIRQTQPPSSSRSLPRGGAIPRARILR